MKTALSTIFVLGLGFALGQLTHLTPVSAQGGGAGQSPCAEDPTLYSLDVDGNDTLNVTDSVAFLRWLFSDGPAPKMCLAPNGGFSGLTHSSQKICYDSTGNVVDCASDTCAGQDAFYATGCPSEGRFVDNGDGTVNDTCTGLMWQQDNGRPFNWCAALAHCENLDLAGHDDWRLPNVRELQSLVDYGLPTMPTIDPVFVSLSSFYWSSTTDADLPCTAWRVAFGGGTGFVAHQSKIFGARLRAVRTITP